MRVLAYGISGPKLAKIMGCSERLIRRHEIIDMLSPVMKQGIAQSLSARQAVAVARRYVR